MRASFLLAAAIVVAAVPPVRGADEPRARTQIEQTLSGIDYLPDRGRLDDLLAGTAELVALANSEDDTVSPGVRLRAYRSLGLFDDPIARDALVDAIDRFRFSFEPIEQMYLIAAIEALADLAGPEDLGPMVDALGHDSRDVRAAAARALGATGLPEACEPLDNLIDIETEPQVMEAAGAARARLDPVC